MNNIIKGHSLLSTVTPAALLLTVTLTPALVHAGVQKVDVCHLTGTGEYITINISSNAVEAHMAHGDGTPNGLVPDGSGDTFDEQCNVVPAPIFECPCDFSTAGLDETVLGAFDVCGRIVFDSLGEFLTVSFIDQGNFNQVLAEATYVPVERCWRGFPSGVEECAGECIESPQVDACQDQLITYRDLVGVPECQIIE